ncbi:MAG: hypothetical protein KC933_41345, partial [Myxococcales bacterium]|nr:hypothetical protein [Myxococcales bacterium]
RYMKAAEGYRPGKLPEASDASKRFGRTQTTEFLNLLRSARAHYEDAVPLGPDKARDRRLDDVRNLLANLDRHYGLR